MEAADSAQLALSGSDSLAPAATALAAEAAEPLRRGNKRDSRRGTALRKTAEIVFQVSLAYDLAHAAVEVKFPE